MARYDILNVGSADVEKKAIICNFSISADKFFEQFSDLVGEFLSTDLTKEIRKAIESGKEVKIDKKYREELDDFFSRVQKKAESMSTSAPVSLSNTSMGYDSEEVEEEAEAETLKSYSREEESISYVDQDSTTPELEIYKKSNKSLKLGEIIPREGENKGLLVPLDIVENLEAKFDFNTDESIEDERKVSGYFKIKNPSTKDKIWSVDITFKKDETIDLDDHISIKDMSPDDEKIIEYNIEDFKEPVLKVKEFISTLNDMDTESYSLSTAEENNVLFKLTALNTAGYPLKNITLKKQIQEGFGDVNVSEPSIGSAEKDGNEILWTIDELDANAEATLSINMAITVEGASSKVSTGVVKAEYDATEALSGVKIDKFDAYSNNFVGVEVVQQDDNPDDYECSVLFENKSEFMLQLVNLDIRDEITNEKVLDVDPEDLVGYPIGEDGAFHSSSWLSHTDDGMEPMFHKTVEFFLVSKRNVSTHGIISINDIELAVALMAGTLSYSLSQIESYRVVPFDTLMQVKNTGGADLNDLILEETIEAGYIPPKAEEIELYVVRPGDGDEVDPSSEEDIQNVDWENLGDQIGIDESMIEITPNDQEPTMEHTVRINLTNLRENALGMFIPGMIIRAKYPIQAYKVAKDTEYVPNVKYTANTYPQGAPIEIIPEATSIPVVHIRKRTVKGKEIRALPTTGEYEITLSVQNAGSTYIENVKVRDLVPNNFEYSNYNLEPAKVDNLEGKDMLIWKIDKIGANETYEITYTIRGVGEEYNAKESQMSL